MPFAARSTEVVKVGYSFSDLDSIATAATLSIGNALVKRGWSYSRSTSDSADKVAVIFNRRGQRDRDFDNTTAAQWQQIEQRFAVAARKLGWSSDVIVAVKEKAVEEVVAIDPLKCTACGCVNDAVIGNCFVCGEPREVVVESDSQLRELIANVKSAVAALETYLNCR